MIYFSEELDRRKFSSIAYYAYCTVHNLNELLTVETKDKYIIVEKIMLVELYNTADTVTSNKWRDKATYLKLV